MIKRLTTLAASLSTKVFGGLLWAQPAWTHELQVRQEDNIAAAKAYQEEFERHCVNVAAPMSIPNTTVADDVPTEPKVGDIFLNGTDTWIWTEYKTATRVKSRWVKTQLRVVPNAAERRRRKRSQEALSKLPD